MTCACTLWAWQCVALVGARLTFTELEFVKDGGFTGGIETDHEDTHLFLAELQSL